MNPKPLIESSGEKLTLRNPLEKIDPSDLAKPDPAGRKTRKGVKRKRGKINSKQGLHGFLMAALLLGALFYDQQWGNMYLSIGNYQLFRNILVGSAYVLLVVQAFQHNMIHGVLCLFLPPYTIIYALMLVDSGALRGFAFAFFVFMGVEWYFTRGASVAMQIVFLFDAMVVEGNRLIGVAGREELKNAPY